MAHRLLGSRLVIVGTLAGVLAHAAAAQGQQFQVNSRSRGAQVSPDVAFEPGGGFVVAFEDQQEVGDWYVSTVSKRRFDPLGAPLENDQTVGCSVGCIVPAVAVDGTGATLVLERAGFGGLAPSPSGGFLFVESDPHDDIYAQRLDAHGNGIGPRTRVNDRPTNARQCCLPLPRVAVGADDGFVVVWNEVGEAPEVDSIQARGFDAGGEPRGPQVRIDPGWDDVRDAFAPDVAALADGRFVVVWDGRTPSASRDAPQAAIVAPTGQPIGAPFPLTVGHGKVPAVAALPGPSGGFAVVHQGFSGQLMLRRFDAAGQPVGVEAQVNQPGYPPAGPAYYDRASLAAASDGALAVVWSSWLSVGGDADLTSVQGRLFPPPDADSDGIPDGDDNCPALANPEQADSDGDGIGDACDPHGPPDSDGDGILDAVDLCPLLPFQDDARTACLLGGRFEVTGEMRDFADPPGTFSVRVMSFPGGRAETDQAVFFDSFARGNFEVGIKMIDACADFPDGHPLRHFWLFAGGLTNARAEVTVADTVSGQSYTWANPPGTFPRSFGDTEAFDCVAGTPSCAATDGAACLLDDRFRITGSMWDFADPPLEAPMKVMSFGAPRAQSDQAVFFESFIPGAFEVGVKLLDACEGLPQGHPLRAFWAFYGGLTNADTIIRVRQIATGRTDTWISPAGSFAQSAGRTQAFPCE